VRGALGDTGARVDSAVQFGADELQLVVDPDSGDEPALAGAMNSAVVCARPSSRTWSGRRTASSRDQAASPAVAT
jgi:hypothetical protein